MSDVLDDVSKIILGGVKSSILKSRSVSILKCSYDMDDLGIHPYDSFGCFPNIYIILFSCVVVLLIYGIMIVSFVALISI